MPDRELLLAVDAVLGGEQFISGSNGFKKPDEKPKLSRGSILL